MFDKLFKKKKYFNCPLMKHSVHFFYDEIRACCSNVKGPVFYENYGGEKVDWDYIYKSRKKTLKDIRGFFAKDDIPDVCKGCCDIERYMSEDKQKDFTNKIEKIYIQNNMSCNAKCTYCTFAYIDKGSKYKVLPLIKDLTEKNILSKNALVYMSGGEITISPEFEELLELLTSYLNSQIEIFTSGIKYCKSIENGFINNKLRLVISLDSGTRETYGKIKQTDCFETVIGNIKSYISASDNAKNTITLKYIIVDGVNDNKEEIEAFLNLVKELGIINTRLDFDFAKYNFNGDKKIPNYYYDLYDFFNVTAKKYGLVVSSYSQIEAILNKNR